MRAPLDAELIDFLVFDGRRILRGGRWFATRQSNLTHMNHHYISYKCGRYLTLVPPDKFITDYKVPALFHLHYTDWSWIWQLHLLLLASPNRCKLPQHLGRHVAQSLSTTAYSGHLASHLFARQASSTIIWIHIPGGGAFLSFFTVNNLACTYPSLISFCSTSYTHNGQYFASRPCCYH
jgi:hypothetical protein